MTRTAELPPSDRYEPVRTLKDARDRLNEMLTYHRVEFKDEAGWQTAHRALDAIRKAVHQIEQTHPDTATVLDRDAPLPEGTRVAFIKTAEYGLHPGFDSVGLSLTLSIPPGTGVGLYFTGQNADRIIEQAQIGDVRRLVGKACYVKTEGGISSRVDFLRMVGDD